MSFVKDILRTYNTTVNDITVDNPITLKRDDCTLINTKKEIITYIHINL